MSYHCNWTDRLTESANGVDLPLTQTQLNSFDVPRAHAHGCHPPPRCRRRRRRQCTLYKGGAASPLPLPVHSSVPTGELTPEQSSCNPILQCCQDEVLCKQVSLDSANLGESGFISFDKKC